MTHIQAKRYIEAIFITLVAALAAACGPEEPRYRIGISQCSSDDWREKMNDEIRLEAMFHDDVEVEIRSADDDSRRQIRDLQYYAENGYDVIVVAPNEAESLTPIIDDIYRRGVPVVVFDRSINSESYTAFQGADNVEVGRQVARYAATLPHPVNILELRGLTGSTPAENRHRGFADMARPLGINILGQADAEWNYEEAARAADSLLALYPRANAIYAHNDRMAIAAADVARRRGRTDIAVIGVDAAPEIGLRAVADSVIDATFVYPTRGDELLRLAIAIAKDEPYERTTLLPIAGAVTADNAPMLYMLEQMLSENMDRIESQQEQIDIYWRERSMQRAMIVGAAVILVLLSLILFLLLRTFWATRRHQAQLAKRNDELAAQRDELDSLYRQLQEATGSKLTFFTNVSHDLRTPLTLIAEPVAQLAAASNLTPEQHTLMQLANKNVKRLLRLVNQILDIRKYDNGQLRLHRTNVVLSEALREWSAQFANIAAKRHIRFNTDIPVEDTRLVGIDVEKVERILFNLLSNSFKFTPENGRIGVSLQYEADEAVIRVSDTGVGIPPEELGQVFERFFRSDRMNPNGSGIGLALSKVFIDMHGGSITADSDQGRQTVFTVRLPLALAPDSEADEAPTADDTVIDTDELEVVEEQDIAVSDDTPTLLVIDDNRDIFTLVKSLLSDRYTVISALNGPQGIRLATRYVPDMIICDVMMPGMDGYAVCRALKGEPLTSHIPVLMLTACTRDEQKREGWECGADAFMSKPFDGAMLEARLQSLLDNRRRIYRHLEHDEPEKGAAPTTPTAAPATDEFLERFTALVEKELSNSELSVESLAERLGISRVQMYRKIKATTNYSAAEMIRNYYCPLKHSTPLPNHLYIWHGRIF